MGVRKIVSKESIVVCTIPLPIISGNKSSSIDINYRMIDEYLGIGLGPIVYFPSIHDIIMYFTVLIIYSYSCI